MNVPTAFLCFETIFETIQEFLIIFTKDIWKTIDTFSGVCFLKTFPQKQCKVQMDTLSV